MNLDPGHIDPAELQPDIEACRADDAAAADRLCARLREPTLREVRRMLGDTGEVEDVVQETLVACLGYLRGDREFDGNAVRLAVTIGRNRCRDILRRRQRRPELDVEPFTEWLAHPQRSALDDLVDSELSHILQDVLDRLSEGCRKLLRALYIHGRTPEQARSLTGLDTVQGVYYRRGVCLQQAKKFLQSRWFARSGGMNKPLQDHRSATRDNDS
jgi:RNA polymerase sigma factor (sigma-70 family)